MGYRVAVAGASGYAGGEVLRLIASHPELQLAAATAHSHAGAAITSVHPHLATYAGHYFASTTPENLSDADVVVLTLPHGESTHLVGKLSPEIKVIDLGSDHRIDPDWTYGLPELPGHRADISTATRVAATGCYAVSVIVALRPLLDAGLVEPDDVVVVAASGTSGAGRTPAARLLASEVSGAVSPYKVGCHQHVPEIKAATGARSVSMTPLLAPMPRGILATVTAKPTRDDISAADVQSVLAQAYDDQTFVRLLPEGLWPHTGATLGSNAVQLQATLDADSGRVIVCSAIDNLGKGAASQIIQCANLMLGLDEATGLAVNGVAP
ncbi:N-acetyl-gamma-glutamyl-phosphate reductase [Natronoglycomyces albus]|uniref:N-acetyl-gamma-glutamyl-phosphate reductase n=1 Tax=Natronoglycomyces albus TaxID=2811108 RepID=A0A895XGU2_9ACTN|nr:N-acetyl-gamma-glutamyl-phosphate reductase [Natronoglycomyces albus]QSB04117.1 N-acetyl-gamma-glutamyl-phosphate reductase [Natronoglycomyces albus]